MSTILKLQRLTPFVPVGEMDVVLISTASGVCPVADEDYQFEME